MKSRKWLIILLAIIVTMMSLATYTGVTRSVFIDDELSTDDAISMWMNTKYYLHNNPTPPTGDTNSQAVLPLGPIFVAPTATTLYDYDQDRDGNAGLFILKGGTGPGETDPAKHQVWRTGSLSSSEYLVGSVTIDIWGAITGFTQGKAGEVFIYLRDYNPSSYSEIGNGNVNEANWQGGSSTWVMKTISISVLNYTIPAGNELEVEVIVGGNSGDDMWFAYDTTSYSSVVEIP